MKVKFVPNNVEFEIKPNESVLKVAHDNGIHIKSVCKGVPSCAECKIQIADGEYNVFKPSPAEVNLIGSAHFVDHSRLACQLKCFGDVTIDLAEQIEKAKRNLVGKRPKGIAAGDDYDPGASQAVKGSILFGDDPLQRSSEKTEKKKP
jgi:2Fe-2S ferredoxin